MGFIVCSVRHSSDDVELVTDSARIQLAAAQAQAQAAAQAQAQAAAAARAQQQQAAAARPATTPGAQARPPTGQVAVPSSVRALGDDERRQMEQKLQEAKTKAAQSAQEVDKLRAEMNQLRKLATLLSPAAADATQLVSMVKPDQVTQPVRPVGETQAAQPASKREAQDRSASGRGGQARSPVDAKHVDAPRRQKNTRGHRQA